eukprot:scaffold65779_cov19-Tisochrysis_lutea.AAC.3
MDIPAAIKQTRHEIISRLCCVYLFFIAVQDAPVKVVRFCWCRSNVSQVTEKALSVERWCLVYSLGAGEGVAGEVVVGFEQLAKALVEEALC